MRRNLRLNWRALALLGALLSLICEWPGLVYAMPAIFPPATATIQPTRIPTSIGAQEAAVNLKPEFQSTLTQRSNHVYNASDAHSESDEQQHHEKQSHKSYEDSASPVTNLTYLLASFTNISKAKAREDSNRTSEDTNPMELAVAESDEQLHHSQRIKISNLISNKRKRKKNADETLTAAISNSLAHSISDNSSDSQRTLLETTTAIKHNEVPTAATSTSASAPQNARPASPNKSNITANDFSTSFTFSSAHHIAILSRTERSIRAEAQHLAGGVGGIVRRSSDIAGGSKTRRLNNSRNTNNGSINQPAVKSNISNLDRNERSTISHLSGPSRKIQLYIKNRFIQLLPDGTVNGTHLDQSEYTILQRSTVDVGRIKIQAVATCLYLCMDQCGAVYGSKDFTDDCVFNENMEQHNYNTYSSTYNSNARRVYYLALNRHGEPRKLQIPPTRSLGKLATYTNAITETVPQDRVEKLIAKNFGENRIKHGLRQLCDTGKPLIELIDSKNFKARPACNPNTSSPGTASATASAPGGVRDSSSANSSSSSGQLLNNVPAANDKLRISNSSSHSSSNSSSSSSISSSSADTNSSSSSSSPSSISNSQSNNGHTSDNSSQQHSGKKKKKRRKCRPHENEEEHNCHIGPQALRKRAHHKNKKCKELQQQQQANGEEVTPCAPKKNGGPKRNGGGKRAHKAPKANHPNQPNANSNNTSADVIANNTQAEHASPNNKRGKKANAGHGSQGKIGRNKNGAKKRGPNANKRGNGKQKKNQHRTTASTTVVPPSTTTPVEESTPQLHLESVSDRGEREQRNVHFNNTSVASDEDEEDDFEQEDESGDSYEDETHATGDAAQAHLQGGADYFYYDQLEFIPIGLWELFALLWIVIWSLHLWH